MKGVVKHIIGSFEDIGKDVARETGKVPTDIAGKALESFGGASGQQGQAAPKAPGIPEILGGVVSGGGTPGAAPQKPEGALGQMETEKSVKVKQEIARAALAQLAGKPKAAEPSVHERLEAETEQRREARAKQAEETRKMEIPVLSTKPKRGERRGKRSKTNAETQKNVRQD